MTILGQEPDLRPVPASTGLAHPSRIVRGVAASYLNIAVGILCNLALVPLCLGHLGRMEYGLWIAVSGLVGYMWVLNLGIAQTTANLCAEAVAHASPQRAIRVVATGFWSYVRVAAFALVGLASVGPFVPWRMLFKGTADLRVSATLVVITCAAAFLVELPFTLFAACLRNLGKIEQQQFVAVAQNVARLIVAFVLLSAGGKLFGLLVLLSGVNILTGLCNFRLMGRQLPGLAMAPRLFDRDLQRGMKTPSAYFLLLQASGAVAFGADVVVIAAILGTSEVVPYGIAQRLAFVATTAVAAISVNFTPGFIAANTRGDRHELRRLFVRATAISALLGSVIGGGLLVVGPTFIRLWVGPSNYVGTVPFVAIVGLLFLQMVLAPADALLVATWNHRAYAVAAAWEAVLGVVLAVVLGMHMGVAGVAIAKVAARIFGAGPLMVLKSYQVVSR